MTPNPGFKVTIYLQVEYLKNRATLLNSTTYNYRPPGGGGSYRKRANNWGSLKILRKKGGNFLAFATAVAGLRAA